MVGRALLWRSASDVDALRTIALDGWWRGVAGGLVAARLRPYMYRNGEAQSTFATWWRRARPGGLAGGVWGGVSALRSACLVYLWRPPSGSRFFGLWVDATQADLERERAHARGARA